MLGAVGTSKASKSLNVFALIFAKAVLAWFTCCPSYSTLVFLAVKANRNRLVFRERLLLLIAHNSQREHVVHINGRTTQRDFLVNAAVLRDISQELIAAEARRINIYLIGMKLLSGIIVNCFYVGIEVLHVGQLLFDVVTVARRVKSNDSNVTNLLKFSD